MMTNHNEHLGTFLKFCIQFFSHSTQEQRDGAGFALKPWSKEWGLNKNLRTHNSWRPSRCSGLLKPLWHAKQEDYLCTGWWEFHSGWNAVPMLMLKKPSKDGILRFRTVVDTHEQNKNSWRLALPLPDIETTLQNVMSHKFCTLLDGKDAYEQIRVESETVMHLPLTSLLMNHIFSDFIGVFMDVYLNDIVVYSDSPEEHVKHVKQVIDQLHDNKFFLSSTVF